MAPPAGSASGAKPMGGPAGAAPAASGASRWMGPIVGLAAGLGLAALASHLGFSGELASVLMLVLLAVAAIVVVRLVMARRAPERRAMPYAGAGAGLGTTPGGYETQVPPPARFEPIFGGAAANDVKVRSLPAGFDGAGFAREARKQFLAVQAAHDRHDAKALADVMTPELLREIAREMEASGAARPTEIVDVDAEVVEVSTEGSNHWVSVRFAGTAREGGVLETFDEVWNLVKPVGGDSGWLIAGIQQQVMPS
jgi:predicted lipid-binding transport protein (Tim44 family)